jgi:hypothetical protein
MSAFTPATRGERQGRYCRRAFLKALGLGPGLLPVLGTDDVFGGCLAKPPRRALFVVWTNGVQEWADGSGGAYTLPAYLKALEPHRNDILPVKGVRLQTLKDTPNPQKADSAGHGATPALLTGKRYKELRPFVEVGGGPSIDQFIAADLLKRGIKTPRASLALGVLQEGYIALWRDAGQPVRPDSDPYRVFADVFAGRAGQPPDPLIDKLRLARRSVLDLVKRDLEGFKRRVGTENRVRIDAHLASVREMEKNLEAGAVQVGEGCAVPAVGARVDVKSTRSFHLITKLQLDIAVAALAADVTRVVAIQMGNEGDNHVVPTWLGIEPTGKGGGLGDENSHHSIAHRGGATKRRIDAWFHEQFAYLIGRLKAEKEGATHMLDSTGVLFANHMANGGSHSIDNIPWLLAGKCGGYLRTGENIKVNNVSHTCVLKELIYAMGADPSGFFEDAYNQDLPPLRA